MCRLETLWFGILLGFYLLAISAGTGRAGEGDDVQILSEDVIYTFSMDIAQNGDIYVAAWALSDTDTQNRFGVYRSQDGGTTWSLWYDFQHPSYGYSSPSLQIAEGTQDRVYVAYNRFGIGSGQQLVRVSWAELGVDNPVWTNRTVADNTPVHSFDYDLIADDTAYASYYLYLAYTVDSSDGDDIWFSRSLDFGNTWETPYEIASSSSGTRNHSDPDLAYGAGIVHCAWRENTFPVTSDSAIKYRRATNDAGSQADWQLLATGFGTSVTDGSRQSRPSIATNRNTNDVVLMYTDSILSDPFRGVTVVRTSVDAGASWPSGNQTTLSMAAATVHESTFGAFAAVGRSASDLYVLATPQTSDPLGAWNLQPYADRFLPMMEHADPVIAYDPSRNDQWAIAFYEGVGAGQDRLLFDAEWRDGPGYPQLEVTEPLASPAYAPPALADLTGNGPLEILFGDQAGEVHVVDQYGDEQYGWPVDIGDFPFQGTVAAGDLDNDGDLEIAAGNTAGQVYAFDHQGSLLPSTPYGSWPVDLGTGASTFVSIGQLSKLSPRQIVAVSGTQIHLLYIDGSERAQFADMDDPIGFAAAIGDVDDDGVAEIVVASGSMLEIRTPLGGSVLKRAFPGKSISDTPTLGDLDLDGDLEIVVPTTQGDVYVLHHDGSFYAGSWPFTAPTPAPINSVAMGQLIGNSRLDLAFSTRAWTVYLLSDGGGSAAGWPQTTDPGWILYGAPIIDRLDGGSKDVIIGSRDRKAHAWNNIFTRVDGWPKDLGTQCEMSPASGDIDEDGSLEIVFTTRDELLIVDVNAPPSTNSRDRWPMDGHDSQRTYCSDCPEDVATSVQDEPGLPTRVYFSVASANPSPGATTFRYDLPAPAAVNLAIHDVRGRIVYTLAAGRQETGSHTMVWNGRDRAGHRIARGSYYARLTVQGPGISEQRTRSVTLLR